MGRRFIDMMLKVWLSLSHVVTVGYFQIGANQHLFMSTGPDDLPAHVKSALIGASVSIPIKDGKLVSCHRPEGKVRRAGVLTSLSALEPGKGFGISSSGR